MSGDVLERLLTPRKHVRLLLTPSYKKGAFDSHAIDCPFPFKHDGKYYMTFVGWDGMGYQNGLASSSDLVNWMNEGLMIGRGPKGSVTEFNVALTNILRDNELYGNGELKKVDGRYVGTYHAYPKPGYEEGAAVIGLCYSKDLKNWEIGDPVLKPEPSCSWEAGGLYKSWLMEDQGTYYMFYNAKNKTEGSWVEQTGVVTSRDLIKWERSPLNPILKIGGKGAFDELFASDPCVFRHNDIWVMFYFGLSKDGHARDSVAISKDLLHWEKSGTVLVDVGMAGSIDSLYAHKAGMIARDGRLYHFYCAVAQAEDKRLGEIEHNEIHGISLATN